MLHMLAGWHLSGFEGLAFALIFGIVPFLLFVLLMSLGKGIIQSFSSKTNYDDIPYDPKYNLKQHDAGMHAPTRSEQAVVPLAASEVERRGAFADFFLILKILGIVFIVLIVCLLAM